MFQAQTHTQTSSIQSTYIGQPIYNKPAQLKSIDRDNADTVIFSKGMTLESIEKSVIIETLRRENYNRTLTAKKLGIGLRTLQRKIKNYREDGQYISDFSRIY